MAFSGFPDEAQKFLAALAKNNRREWFQPKKAIFEETVKLPLIGFVAEVNEDLHKIAPEHVVPAPERALSRIYRDTRFAKDKAPYKTNMYAVWPHRALGKEGGAAFYFSLSAKEVAVGGGVWMPMPPQLKKLRDWIDEHHARLRKILASPALKKTLGELYAEDRLTRPPRGFAAEHPAVDLLRYKSLVLTRRLPGSVATTPKLHKEVRQTFATLAPFVAALDEALA